MVFGKQAKLLREMLGSAVVPDRTVLKKETDEFDKICTPSYSANNGDVHLEVQHNLLTLVEGSRVETKQGYVNTNKLLFIGMGSFDQFRKKREKDGKEPIGFGAVAELFESANSKFGCRLIESQIREVVLKAYSEAMQKDSTWDVMDLKIDTLNSYTFGFREYTQEEIELEEAFQSGSVHKEIPVPKMIS